MLDHAPISLRSIAAAALALALAACGDSKPQGGGMMAFPPAQVTTETVQPASFPVAFEFVGQVIGSKDAEVRPRVTGIVEKRFYEEGSTVKAGQPLFLIDPRPYEAQLAQAEADLARAQAEKSRAERELARLKPLAEKRAIGQKEADDAQSQADLADAAIKAAQARLTEAKLNLSYTRVLAPISGVTGRAQQSEGSLATANTTLLTTIWQVDPIWIGFSMSENERLKLERARAEGRLTLPDNNSYDVEIRLSDGSSHPRRGRVDFTSIRFNPQTGTQEMRATVRNPDRALQPGQFVRVVLTGAERQNVITVPQVAVLDGPQGKFVYVVGKNDKGADVAQPRPVVPGDWTDGSGNRWVIESGLKPGDQVIVDGVARVMMPGAPVQVAAPGAPGAPAGPPVKSAASAPEAPAKK